MADYLEPVTGVDLLNAREAGSLDAGAQHLLEAERTYIEARRRTCGVPEAAPLTALALSGGGIRSAAFALGVMQKLAAEKLLPVFDYLSTVSGGGYIGSSLTWLTSTKFQQKSGVTFGVGGAGQPFPYGVEGPGAEPPSASSTEQKQFLAYLRSHGQYLMPGGGITLVSAIAVVLRGILLNLLVWFPIVTYAAVLLRAVPATWFPAWLSWAGGGLYCIATPCPDTPPTPPHCGAATGAATPPAPLCLPAGFAWIFAAALLLWLIFVLASIFYSLRSYSARKREQRRYRQRRRFERCAHYVLLFAVGFTIVGTIPWVAGFIAYKGGIGFLLAGAGGGLASFLRSRLGKVSGLLAPIIALLLCYGVLILAYHSAVPFAAFAAEEWAQDWLTPGQLLLVVLVVLPFGTGYFVNLNYVTLHRFYRDRLMEAFMPDIERVRENRSGPAMAADPVQLSEMCQEHAARGPYHLINTNLILTATEDKTRKTRGGDSFILSPRYCGSNATGWRATREFLNNSLTLPTAMAISGAAANPSTGSGGVGVTRNPIVSVVMSLLNVRLGYWITHPNPQRARTNRRPNHFEPGLVDIVDWKRNETSRTLRLSDGGHFDNLGLHELVRRRVRFIVVSDAGADPNCAFADLTNAIARVEQDFGVRIVFEDRPALAPLMPSIDLPFPREERRPKRAFAKAAIHYAGDPQPGILIYLTTLLIDGLRLPLLGYLSANREFPDETTADQFFSEAQFEAYRELGYCVAGQMLEGTRDDKGETDSPGLRDVFTTDRQAGGVGR